MYYNRQNQALRRTDDSILRRMLGGSAAFGAIPVMDTVPPTPSGNMPPINEPDCNSDDPTQQKQTSENEPNNSCGICPSSVYAPSLAMVYSPRQCFRHLMSSPEEALQNGTLFRELALPFEGAMKGGK